MANCIKIQVCDNNILKDAPPHLLTNGLINLPLPVDFNLSLSKTVAELNDIGQLKEDAALSFSVGYSPEWTFIFECILIPNVIDFGAVKIEVVVWRGDKLLEFDTIYLQSADDATCTYEVGIESRKSNICTLLEECRLCDTYDETETFTFSYGNIDSNINTINGNDGYQDGALGYLLAPIDRGGLDLDLGFTIEACSFLPLFSKLDLLQRIFCKIGYSFKSPIFESEWGRRQFVDLNTDLSETKFNDYFGFNLGIIGTIPLDLSGGSEQLYFPTVTTPYFDNNNFYNPMTGIVSGLCGTHQICFNVRLSIPPFIPSNITFTGAITIRKNSSTLFSKIFEINSSMGIVDIQGCSASSTFVPSDVLDVFIVPILLSGSFDIRVNSGSRWYNEPVKTSLCQDIVIPINEFLSCDSTGKEFLEGVIHDINGKLLIDPLNNSVELYPPRQVDFFGERYDGYNLEEIEELSIKPSSKVVTNNENETDRYCEIGYKETSDKYIEDILVKENLFGTTIDLGDQYLEETKDNRNPLFEPTAEKEMNFTFFNPDQKSVYASLIYTEDEGEEKSEGYDARQLTWHGLITQDYIDDNGDYQDRRWLRNGSTRTSFPYLSQCPLATINEGEALPFYNVYYDENKENNFYDKFYKDEFFQAVTFSFKALLSFEQFCCIDVFRKRYCVRYRGVEYVFRMKAILDKLTCSNEPVQIEFIPENDC